MSIAISNVTKITVPINLQRNKELNLRFKLRDPASTPEVPVYLNLTEIIFKMKVADADGNQKILFDNNRFGIDDDFQRSLTISEAEAETFDPNEKYYYDLLVTNQGKKDYWLTGRVIPFDRITT